MNLVMVKTELPLLFNMSRAPQLPVCMSRTSESCDTCSRDEISFSLGPMGDNIKF